MAHEVRAGQRSSSQEGERYYLWSRTASLRLSKEELGEELGSEVGLKYSCAEWLPTV